MSPVAFKLPGDPETTVAAALYAPASDRDLNALFVFAHGAGAGQFHPFITGYAEGLATRGVTVVTFNFPYMEKRRKTPDRAPVLEDAFRRAVVGAVEQRHVRASKLFIGGKSMGGRIASQVAALEGADKSAHSKAATPNISGLVLLGYPLHPPGRPEKLRDAHLKDINAPVLFIQGSRDAFGSADELKQAIKKSKLRATLYIVEGGDHSLKVPKSGGVPQTQVYESTMDEIAGWLDKSKRGKI